MHQPIENVNFSDEDGNPAGGFAHGTGISIQWQAGPLGRDQDRIEPNGAFVEDLILIVIERIAYYQSSRFHSIHNAVALGHVRAALEVLTERTRDREDRKVEGTHAR